MLDKENRIDTFESKNTTKLKGVSKVVVKNGIKHENYLDVLNEKVDLPAGGRPQAWRTKKISN